MEYSPLVIGDKKTKYPLVQGGMGVGISLGGLAGAVAKAGGVGLISSVQIGFREPDFESNPFEANLRAMEKEYRLATELPAYVKGFATKIAPIVSGEKAAQVLLKLWDKRYQTTADMVVIEGPLAGGHLGFSKEEAENLSREEYEGTICKIIRVVKEYALKYGKKIPVVVAGGMDSPQQVERMLELGADGVQVASAFVATVECDADMGFKQKYVEAGIREPIKKCYGCLNKCNPTEIPYCITKALITSAMGDADNGLVFCGADTYRITKISTVQEVIENLFQKC